MRYLPTIIAAIIAAIVVFCIFQFAPTVLQNPVEREIIKVVGIVGAILIISLLFRASRQLT